MRNKKSIFVVFILIITVLHILMFKYTGISLPSSTLLFYYLIYLGIKQLLSIIKNLNLRQLMLINLRITLVLCLVLEFVIAFVLKWDTQPTEQKNGVYHSTYKGYFVEHFCQGYKPYSTYFQNGNDPRYIVNYNSKGLRGTIPVKEKKMNELRVAALGDSFVEGYGSPNDSTIPILIENKLKAFMNVVSVMNAGICGSNPLYEICLYNNTIKQYNPDIVLIFTNVTDIMDVEYYLHQHSIPVYEYFFATSHIFRILYGHLVGYDLSKETNCKWSKAKVKYYSNLIVEKISLLENELRMKNQRLVVVYVPLKEEITGSKKVKWSKALHTAIVQSKLTYIDLGKHYRQYFKQNINEIDNYYLQNDFHNNSLGYNLIAQIIVENLKNDILNRQ